jgi:hypothetical protein
MSNVNRERALTSPEKPRRAWEAPRVTDLPRLTELTLQTGPGIPGNGGPGGGGSTVIP